MMPRTDSSASQAMYARGIAFRKTRIIGEAMTISPMALGRIMRIRFILNRVVTGVAANRGYCRYAYNVVVCFC